MRLSALPFVLVLVALAGTATLAQARTTDVRSLVKDLAAGLAKTEYRPKPPVPAASAIDYTQYLGIRVKPGSEIWAEREGGFQLHPMPLGSLFVTPIELNLVDGGKIEPLATSGDLYEHNLPLDRLPPGGDLGVSGFRVTAPLNHAGTQDEVIVFQGASYFRVLSKGQVYGLSARALSIGAGQNAPEEFPALTRFWIETPGAADSLVIHALLDSQSVAGAYTFMLRPGAPSVVDVEATIYPRRDLDNVGIAPLSSMFFYAVGDGAHHVRDYRPEVHDSDGLLIATGRGERLWRPLRNPAHLRASSFSDTGLRGFGLMQRERSFELYHDLEANYHRRPSAWIEPTSDWGPGAVELFEIPTDSEYHDNIVAQWRPAEPLRARSEYRYSYRITWPDHAPPVKAPSVKWTRSGPAVNALAGPDTERFVIDYAESGLDPKALPDANVTANVGTISSVSLQPNPETGGLRLSFLYAPAGNDVAEFRAQLSGPGTKGAETWLYQWMRAKN